MNECEPFPDTLSDVYDALSASRRCYVIQLLSDADERPVATRELARHITMIEEDIPKKRATGEPYRNVYNALSQTHLPVLSDAGITIYDADRQTVAAGPNFRISSLIIEVNKATYHTLRNGSFPNQGDAGSSMTD